MTLGGTRRVGGLLGVAGRLSGTVSLKKAERRRIDAFELWCWRRLLRVPWIAKRSNQSILKEISPGMKVKSESEVSQLCPTLSDPMG